MRIACGVGSIDPPKVLRFAWYEQYRTLQNTACLVLKISTLENSALLITMNSIDQTENTSNCVVVVRWRNSPKTPRNSYYNYY